jgi:hypothetical protein
MPLRIIGTHNKELYENISTLSGSNRLLHLKLYQFGVTPFTVQINSAFYGHRIENQ